MRTFVTLKQRKKTPNVATRLNHFFIHPAAAVATTKKQTGQCQAMTAKKQLKQ